MTIKELSCVKFGLISLPLLDGSQIDFYRAMHYSAKRGIEFACRPSVRLSLCNVGGSGSHKLEILETIAQTILPQHLRSSSPKAIYLFPGEHGEISGRLEVGWEKVACWSTKAAISLKRIKIDVKLLWMAFRNSPTLFRTVPHPTPYGLP